VSLELRPECTDLAVDLSTITAAPAATLETLGSMIDGAREGSVPKRACIITTGLPPGSPGSVQGSPAGLPAYELGGGRAVEWSIGGGRAAGGVEVSRSASSAAPGAAGVRSSDLVARARVLLGRQHYRDHGHGSGDEPAGSCRGPQ
jgi:hypothetical protein